MNYDVLEIRRHFPALETEVGGHPLVYLDNAATAQMSDLVADMVRRQEQRRGNVHRGIHHLSEEATWAYEQARRTVAEFIHADPSQIVFTAGTTDGINRIAWAFGMNRKGGQTALTTCMEHNSNFLPWQQLCRRTHTPFDPVRLTADGELDMEDLRRKLTGDVALLAVTHCSNVHGAVNDIREICSLAHARNIPVLIDAAQSICHMDLDVRELGCDYLVFSGHKLGAPFGIGVLYCRAPMPPVFFGGGMVQTVSLGDADYMDFPYSWEAGTPNVSGAIGLAAAISFRRSLQQDWQLWEQRLLRQAEEGLRMIAGVRILGSPRQRLGSLSFVMEGAHPFDAAKLADCYGIALRSGHHCAPILLQSLGCTYSLRISPNFYNTEEEIAFFLETMNRINCLIKNSRG